MSTLNLRWKNATVGLAFAALWGLFAACSFDLGMAFTGLFFLLLAAVFVVGAFAIAREAIKEDRADD